MTQFKPYEPHSKGKKLLDQYRDALYVKHYSARTEETYKSPLDE